MIYREKSESGKILVFVTFFLILSWTPFSALFGKLFFPSIVDLLGIEVGKDEVEDIRIPTGGVTLNAFFDILYARKERNQQTCSYTCRSMGSMENLTSGSSSQSEVLSAGNMIVFAPARRAATVFSRKPPIRRTFPVTVNSPVIAMVGSNDLSMARDKRAVAMVIPADGPWDVC